jgi:coenzyme F420-reducing hydrogenase delta subunit/ferredoxin
MGVARLTATDPASVYTRDIVQAVLVIGSDLGGLVTATTLADQGIPVTLIDAYGGPDQGPDPGDGVSELYKAQLDTAQHHPQITLLPEAQITAVSGQSGDYTVRVSRYDETLDFHAGAIVVAMGNQDDAYPGPLSAPPAKSDLQHAIKIETAAVHPGTETLDPETVPLSPFLPRNRKLDALANWLCVPQDISGFLIKSRPRLRPGQYVDDGIFVVGNAHRPVSGPAAWSQALLVSARVLGFLQQTTLRTESSRAAIESARCTGCGTCIPVCPSQAISLKNRPGILSVARVAALRCTGCGGCIAACPTRAINIPGWEDSAILAQISAALEAPPRLICMNGNSIAAPRLLVFSCEWSAYAAAELAGARQISYSPDLRFIPLNCAARFDPNHVLWAFLNGADGVLLGACRPGDCHHRTGNQLAVERLAHLKSQLADHGVDPRRLYLAQFSGDDVEAFVRTVTEFSTLFLNPDTPIHRLG